MIKKHLTCLLALAAILSVGFQASAQTHSLNISDDTGATGDTVTLSTLYTHTATAVAGWSYGVGQNPADLDLVAGSAVQGSTTATVKSGGPPDFSQINEFTNGWTVGVVICFLGCSPLPAGTDYELNRADYMILMTAGSSDVCYTDALGSPPVATVVVVAGQSIIPTQSCGTVTVLVQAPFEYTAESRTVCNDGTGLTDVLFGIEDTAGSVDNTQGFSMGAANDPAVLTPVAGSVSEFGVLTTVTPTGPDFFGPATFPNGWTVGVVYSFLGMAFLQFGTLTNVVSVDYTVNGAQPDGSTTSIQWVDTLGMPAVANVVVVAGQSVAPGFNDGTITFDDAGCGPVIPVIIRSDCNQDGINNIADGIFTIGILFYGYAEACTAACDANGDGMVDVSDAMYTFSYQFLDGPAPPAPFPNCGIGSASDAALGCADSACP